MKQRKSTDGSEKLSCVDDTNRDIQWLLKISTHSEKQSAISRSECSRILSVRVRDATIGNLEGAFCLWHARAVEQLRNPLFTLATGFRRQPAERRA